MKFYGFISNGMTAALISPEGSIDWLPFPRFDGASVFTRLLGDDRHGYFAVEVDGGQVSDQRYIERTNILRTEWTAPQGKLVSHDYLAIGRPELHRIIESDVPFALAVHPRFEYGSENPQIRAIGRGAIYLHANADEALICAVKPFGGTKDPHDFGDVHSGRWNLPPGQYDIILQFLGNDLRERHQALSVLNEQADEIEHQLEARQPTVSLANHIHYWQSLIPNAGEDIPEPFHSAVERGLLVLYGLTYRTTGAIIAAPTTSLPETIGETRQWDYRFAWVRDGSYAAEALLMAGDPVTTRRFLEFMLNCVVLQGRPFTAPFFHVDGHLIRGEENLNWLPGYRGSKPCREGNAASHQVQADIEGEFIWTVYRYIDVTGRTSFLDFYWNFIRIIVEWVNSHWTEKDASLWEFRNQDAHYTHSKLMSWVALYYGAHLAGLIGRTEEQKKWHATALKVKESIETHAYNAERGHYVQAFDGDHLDAALLLLPLYGFCEVSSPRFQGTLRAIETALVKDHWVFRYSSDMLGKASHPFVLATSWLARIYLRMGNTARAQWLLEQLLSHQTDLGLLGEHADVDTGEPRGNFPQGFSHLGIVMAVLEWQHLAPIPQPVP